MVIAAVGDIMPGGILAGVDEGYVSKEVLSFLKNADIRALILLTSCELRPLSDLNKNLLLRLKINLQIQNVDEPPTVEVMRVIFYDPNTNRRFTEDYIPSEGGYISVPPGDYKLIVYNFDTESTLIRNDMQLYQMEAYTNEISQQIKNKALSVIGRSKAEIAVMLFSPFQYCQSFNMFGLWEHIIRFNFYNVVCILQYF